MIRRECSCRETGGERQPTGKAEGRLQKRAAALVWIRLVRLATVHDILLAVDYSSMYRETIL
jgi:hypothetical protein